MGELGVLIIRPLDEASEKGPMSSVWQQLSRRAQEQKHSGNERSRQDLWVTKQRTTQTGKARVQAAGSISRPEVILML